MSQQKCPKQRRTESQEPKMERRMSRQKSVKYQRTGSKEPDKGSHIKEIRPTIICINPKFQRPKSYSKIRTIVIGDRTARTIYNRRPRRKRYTYFFKNPIISPIKKYLVHTESLISFGRLRTKSS